ncbi:MAG: pupG, partial [Bacteroidetes bacterium]|nr:pupG [Bacteroidota bacterium]
MEARSAHTNKRSVSQAVGYIRTKTKLKPHIALILGSGLGDFVDSVEREHVIRNEEIPGYPPSTVPGHAGKIVLGYLRTNSSRSKPLLVFQGRVHFYESGSLSPAFLPVQIAHGLGCKILIVTNAAGGINRRFQAGDLMLIRDIINLTNLQPHPVGTLARPSRHK